MSYENVIWKQPRPGTSGNKAQLLDRRPKVRSEENLEMKSTITRFWLITIALAVALAMSGCGGGGGGGNGDIPMPGGSTQVTLLDGWKSIESDALEAWVGVNLEGYDLRAWYDDNLEPQISLSDPIHQPTIRGTWNGRWAGYIADDERPSEGDARVAVTADPSGTDARLTYYNVPEFGSISSGMMSVDNGAFGGIETVPGAGTFEIRGQFGGPEQVGVAGYVDGPEFKSVFHGIKH